MSRDLIAYIEAGGAVRTRNGVPVEIISVKARGRRPIIGYVGGSDEISRWYRNGSYLDDGVGRTHYDDLLPAPVKRWGWVNVYPTTEPAPDDRSVGRIHATEAEAAAQSEPDRVGPAVRIEWEEPADG